MEDKKCFGCGACVVACPSSSLEMGIDEGGFLNPRPVGQCTQCGLCEEVCPALYPSREEAKSYQVFAAFSLTPALRLWCSSGGVFTSLALEFMAQGGSVIGVAFGEDFRRVYHFMAEKIQDIFRFSGSKYIQSDPASVLRSVQGLPEKFLFVGTPCQVAGVRRLIECGVLRGDFTLIDFFCHGVPSYVLWNSYLNFLQKRVGRILHIEQRFKITDWHRYRYRVFGSKGVYCRGFEEDPFGFLYLQNYLLRESCYTCPYRGYHSFADLRLGDFWGELFSHDRLGTSLVVAFTEKGFQILVENKDVFLQSMPREIVLTSQAVAIQKPVDAGEVFTLLKKQGDIEQLIKRHFLRKVWQGKLRKIALWTLRKPMFRIPYKVLKKFLRR